MQYQFNTHCLENLKVDLLYPLIASYGIIWLIQKMSITQRSISSHLGPIPLWPFTLCPMSSKWPHESLKTNSQTLATGSLPRAPWRPSTSQLTSITPPWTPWTPPFLLQILVWLYIMWLSYSSFLRTGKHIQNFYPNLWTEMFFTQYPI